MFLKEILDVLMAILLIQKAWGEASEKTLNSAWKMLFFTGKIKVFEGIKVGNDIITVAQK